MMFIVGIDVAKRSHEVSIITSEVASKQQISGLSDIKILENCLCTGK